MPSEEQTYREGVKASLERIEKKLDYTNGKVRRLVIAVTGIVCLLLGYSAKSLPDLVSIVHSLL